MSEIWRFRSYIIFNIFSIIFFLFVAPSIYFLVFQLRILYFDFILHLIGRTVAIVLLQFIAIFFNFQNLTIINRIHWEHSTEHPFVYNVKTNRAESWFFASWEKEIAVLPMLICVKHRKLISIHVRRRRRSLQKIIRLQFCWSNILFSCQLQRFFLYFSFLLVLILIKSKQIEI